MAILITFKKKQPTELFYKKRRSQKLRNIHMKTSVLESPFNSEYFDIFKTTYFEEHLRMTPSQKLNHETETIKNSS